MRVEAAHNRLEAFDIGTTVGDAPDDTRIVVLGTKLHSHSVALAERHTLGNSEGVGGLCQRQDYLGVEHQTQ